MNIVVIGKANHLEWDSSVVDTFIELGHNVRHFRINRPPTYIKSFKLFSKTLTHKLYAERIKKELLEFKPDIVFFVSAFFIPIEYFQMVKELSFNTRVVAWDADEAVRYESNRVYGEYIDILFSATNYYVKNHFHEFSHVHLLQSCVDTKKFKNSQNSTINKAYFAAACNQDRCNFIQAISNSSIVLKGWGWENCSLRNDTNIELKNKKIKLSEIANDYDKYTITLNLHQKENAINGGLNMRTFEASACGSMVICDERKDLDFAYEKNKEIITYSSFEEANDLISKYLKDRMETKRISENAYKRTMAEHTYQVRLQQALNIIDQY